MTAVEHSLRTTLDVVDLCRDLIALPSENPPGGETAVAEKVGALLSIVAAIILLLLVPLYWPLIGIGR